MLILREGAPIQLFQLTLIHHFRVTEHRRLCMYRDLPFGGEQIIWHSIKTTRFYETSSKLRQPKLKAWPEDFFYSYLKGKDNDWSTWQGFFYGVISVRKDCWIWKKQYKMVCVIIKRKSVTTLELSESLIVIVELKYISTVSHSLRECQL